MAAVAAVLAVGAVLGIAFAVDRALRDNGVERADAKLAAALGVTIATLFDGQPAGSVLVSRKKDYPVVSFDGSSERWSVLGAGLFQGKIRAVVSTLDAKSRGVATDKVVIKPGQMKLFYVLKGRVALLYNGERHVLDADDSALLDGSSPHGWENLGTGKARALWVILG